MTQTSTDIGNLAEQTALEFLQKQGLQLIAKNWSQPLVGEIDLVMYQQKELIFVEVRYRKNNHFGGAAASITTKKQQKIIHTAQHFLMQHDAYNDFNCRFDVIAIENKTEKQTHNTSKNQSINWIKAAFSL